MNITIGTSALYGFIGSVFNEISSYDCKRYKYLDLIQEMWKIIADLGFMWEKIDSIDALWCCLNIESISWTTIISIEKIKLLLLLFH